MRDLIPVFGDRSCTDISQFLSQAFDCSECNADATSLTAYSTLQHPLRYLIACDHCHHRGAFAKNLPDTLAAWNGVRS